MEIPKHKVAQNETIQAEIDSYFAKGEEVETVKQGQIKEGKAAYVIVGRDGKSRRKKL
jgi:uncharacterized membrane-anchored protein